MAGQTPNGLAVTKKKESTMSYLCFCNDTIPKFTAGRILDTNKREGFCTETREGTSGGSAPETLSLERNRRALRFLDMLNQLPASAGQFKAAA